MGVFNKIVDVVIDKVVDWQLDREDNSPKRKKIEQEFERITAYPINIVGLRYENRMDIIKQMNKNTPVYLKREPNNPYDTNAIAIYEKEKNQQIGYLPRNNNTAIAEAMDVGLAVYASIYKISHKIEEETAKENDGCLVTLIIAFHPNHIPDKIEAEKKRENATKQIAQSRNNYPVKSVSIDNNDNWDDRGSVWDDYDEDGLPYEDYKNY